MSEGAEETPVPHGLFASTKGLLTTCVSLLHNRFELFSVELAEEKSRLISLLAYGGAAFLCIAAGLIFLAIFFTVMLWDNNRLLALGIFSALFLGAGLASLVLAMNLARSGSKLFSASLAELRKDRESLATGDVAKSP